jgi:aminomethyltransferase
VSIGTAFHPRTAPLNRKMQWREWSGYFSASVYADHHDIEYNAIRDAAALIDVSPLFKYLVTGPDATRLVDRVIVRDATKLQVDQVYYACWCDEDGRVIDDGTVTRLGETTYRWTAADPSLRWFRQNAAGLEVEVEEITETTAALALQGPLSRSVLEATTGESFADLRYFRRRASHVGDLAVDVTRTGYTGDLGYELWVDSEGAVHLWDAVMETGRPFGIRPVGMLALDVARIEAGLILIEVDFNSVRHAVIREQAFSPFELNLGWMVKFDKADYVGKRALEAEQAAGGPPRRLVGLDIDWDGIERLHASVDLPPAVSATASRTPVPVYVRGRQLGRATSITWSPTLKRMIALASVEARHAEPGMEVSLEWTVEARRGRAGARVTALPFFDPPRKRS